MMPSASSRAKTRNTKNLFTKKITVNLGGKFYSLALGLMLITTGSVAWSQQQRAIELLGDGKATYYLENLEQLCDDAVSFNLLVAGNPSAKGFASIVQGWIFLGQINQSQSAKIARYMRKNCPYGLKVPR